MALGEVNTLVVKRLALFLGTSSRDHRARRWRLGAPRLSQRGDLIQVKHRL
jgi:hypothetical protein